MAKATNKQPAVTEETLELVYASHTACHFNHNGKEFSLYNNETYQLPNCDFVQSLIAQGLLVEKK